jgi:endonuclease-8
MPEGDTVYLTAKRLDQALSGQRLTTSDFRVPAWAEVDLVGQTVDETVSRGKHLLTRIGDVTLHTHLKMEGSWHIYRSGSRWRSPAFQARVVLANATWQAVGFRLGVVEIVRRSDEESVVGYLGPDLLGADWSLDEALSRIQAQPGVPIGEALLDQRNLAGIGTLYRSETLFLSGVHPESPVHEVPDLAKVIRLASRLMLANKDRAEQVTTGDRHRGRRNWVYERQHEPCLRCGTPIEFNRIGPPGRERPSYWCPTCQPADG